MKNPLKAALKAGEAQVGSWLGLSSPFATRYLSQVGFKWLTVDIEHSSVNWETAAQMFWTIAQAGCVPLARVPSNSHENIKRVLDNGAMGIVVPMVKTAEEAKRAVEATRYHPKGDRSVGGGLHNLNFGVTAAEYFAHASDEIFVAVQTEHVDSVENAEEICSVDGVDAIFVGPNDLLQSMGKTPGMESPDPEFVDAMNHLRETATKHGVAPGLHTLTAEQCSRRLGEGWKFIALASDVAFMMNGAKSTLKDVGIESDGSGVRY
jgi:4-hydroxy-2-oxoheptanedioate aldolase